MPTLPTFAPPFESMLQEAKFHTVVERKPLRLASAGVDAIPEEFEGWVGPTTTTRINGEQQTAATADATA